VSSAVKFLRFLKPKRDTRVAGKLEPTQGNVGNDAFDQCEKLKSGPEKFGMEQRLQGTAGRGIRVGAELFRQQCGHEAGREMVLIGEPGHSQAMRLRPFGQAGPIYVRCNIGAADLG